MDSLNSQLNERLRAALRPHELARETEGQMAMVETAAPPQTTCLIKPAV